MVDLDLYDLVRKLDGSWWVGGGWYLIVSIDIFWDFRFLNCYYILRSWKNEITTDEEINILSKWLYI